MDKDERATRLAEALRSNLRRRKSQSREQRAATDGDDAQVQAESRD